MIPEEMGDARRRFLAGVYAESGPRLYRYALMILADRRDAEDVLQQVFATVLAKRTLPAIDDAGAYFRIAVRNAAYSLLRHRRTVRSTEETIARTWPWAVAAAALLAITVGLHAAVVPAPEPSSLVDAARVQAIVDELGGSPETRSMAEWIARREAMVERERLARISGPEAERK